MAPSVTAPVPPVTPRLTMNVCSPPRRRRRRRDDDDVAHPATGAPVTRSSAARPRAHRHRCRRRPRGRRAPRSTLAARHRRRPRRRAGQCRAGARHHDARRRVLRPDVAARRRRPARLPALAGRRDLARLVGAGARRRHRRHDVHGHPLVRAVASDSATTSASSSPPATPSAGRRPSPRWTTSPTPTRTTSPSPSPSSPCAAPLAIVVLPMLRGALQLDDPAMFGSWVGASVHDVGQVVATASGGGRQLAAHGRARQADPRPDARPARAGDERRGAPAPWPAGHCGRLGADPPPAAGADVPRRVRRRHRPALPRPRPSGRRRRHHPRAAGPAGRRAVRPRNRCALRPAAACRTASVRARSGVLGRDRLGGVRRRAASSADQLLSGRGDAPTHRVRRRPGRRARRRSMPRSSIADGSVLDGSSSVR